MTESKAINVIQTLYVEWVSARVPAEMTLSDKVAQIKASLAWEFKANKQVPARCDAANKSETRGKAILLGKAAKVLNL